MKILTLIVHAEVKQVLADTLRGLPQVRSFTFIPAEGYGLQESGDVTLSARELVVGYVPHIRVDVVLEENDVGNVLEKLRNNQGGLSGRGSYWVTALERQGQL